MNISEFGGQVFLALNLVIQLKEKLYNNFVLFGF
jgi:hypothetical protein